MPAVGEGDPAVHHLDRLQGDPPGLLLAAPTPAAVALLRSRCRDDGRRLLRREARPVELAVAVDPGFALWLRDLERVELDRLVLVVGFARAELDGCEREDRCLLVAGLEADVGQAEGDLVQSYLGARRRIVDDRGERERDLLDGRVVGRKRGVIRKGEPEVPHAKRLDVDLPRTFVAGRLRRCRLGSGIPRRRGPLQLEQVDPVDEHVRPALRTQPAARNLEFFEDELPLAQVEGAGADRGHRRGAAPGLPCSGTSSPSP